jgi:hypothetical protein
MNYLSRLKQLEGEKNSPDAPDIELTKLTEPPFGGFGSNYLGHIGGKLSDTEVLRLLVLEVMVLVNEPQADWQYYVDDALADPVDAMTCYKALKRDILIELIERHSKTTH